MPRRPPPEKKKVGRRSLLTEERADTICKAAKDGQHLTIACALAGISYATLFRWLDNADAVEEAINRGLPYDPDHEAYLEFRDRLTRARAQGEARVVDAVVKDVLGGQLASREPVMETIGGDTRVARGDDGEVLYRESWTTPNGRTGLAFLSRSAPDRWSEKQRVELTGADGDPLLGAKPAASGESPLEETDVDVEALVERLAIVAAQRRAGDDQVEEPVDAELVEDGDDG